MSRKVGNLHLPLSRVDDRPRRQQEHSRFARAEYLVKDLDPVAFDVAVPNSADMLAWRYSLVAA